MEECGEWKSVVRESVMCEWECVVSVQWLYVSVLHVARVFCGGFMLVRMCCGRSSFQYMTCNSEFRFPMVVYCLIFERELYTPNSRLILFFLLPQRIALVK